MIFFDKSILCSDVMSPNLNSTNVSGINSIALKGGAFDELYGTNDVSDTYISTIDIPSEWDFDTAIHAKFDSSLVAGNIDFVIDNVDALLLMRREENEFKWSILDKYDINVPEDFNIKFKDNTTSIGKSYEYSLTPVINGILGNYNKTKVKSESDRLVIIDRDEVWSTYITDGFLDTTRTYPGTPVQTLYNRYPTIVRNTVTNFDTITVTGTWIPGEGNECQLMDVSNSNNFPYITDYAKRFIDFLTNGKPKMVKAADARIWLVWINDGITDSADQYYMNRKITFTATEIGDPTNNEDLIKAGILPEYVSEWL